ncbi:MAG: hypothetical protein IKE22_09135, partial [Atopobiaceae bacterium]|nr:hypothetical protein [Atopobiaceae bacterium]
MADAVPMVFWFDRFDERIGILPVVGELVHAEELFELGHSARGLNARAFSLKTCQRARFLNARSVYPAVARTSKPHAAKADAAYVESGVAKSRVLHGLLSSVASS